MMVEKMPRMPCVLGEDGIDCPQDIDRPEGNVAQVADRSADDVQRPVVLCPVYHSNSHGRADRNPAA